jgi:polysaccharide biosynthesis transport protein
MELVDVVGVLRRFWRSIVATLVACAALGGGLLMLQQPVYSSTAIINFMPQVGGSASQLKAAMEYAAEQAVTYAQVATTPLVTQKLKESLNTPESTVELASQLNVAAAGTQAAIFVTANRPDAESAARYANAEAAELVKTVGDFSPPGSTETIKAVITQPAVAPARPSSPVLLNNILIAIGVGLALGVGQAFLRHALDTRVQNPEDIQRVTNIPVIGEIPFDEEVLGSGSGRRIEPFSLRSEAYRRLRTNLQFRAIEGHGNAILVTSSLAGEGKTSTAVNIAAAFAQNDQRVRLVDADLRRPRVHHTLGLENEVGLSSALLHGLHLKEAVQPHAGMDVLTSGPKPPNPAELLGSGAMQKLYAEACDLYDLVVFDTPPLLPVTDALVLGRMGAGTVLVADQTRLVRRQLLTSAKNLAGVDAPVLGIVLNKIKLGVSNGYYGYGYKASYNYQYSDASNEKGKRASGRRSSRGRKTKTKGASSGGRRASSDDQRMVMPALPPRTTPPQSPVTAQTEPVDRDTLVF